MHNRKGARTELRGLPALRQDGAVSMEQVRPLSRKPPQHPFTSGVSALALRGRPRHTAVPVTVTAVLSDPATLLRLHTSDCFHLTTPGLSPVVVADSVRPTRPELIYSLAFCRTGLPTSGPDEHWGAARWGRPRVQKRISQPWVLSLCLPCTAWTWNCHGAGLGMLFTLSFADLF